MLWEETMMWQQKAPGCLFLLTGASILHLSSLNPISLTGQDGSHQDILLGPSLSGDGKDIQPPQTTEMDDKEDNVLFGDIDPRQLADILVEALKGKGTDKTLSEEKDELKDKNMVRRADNGRKELEMLVSTQRQEQERDQDKEKLTENVTSRTTSQSVPVQAKQPPAEAESAVVEGQRSGALRQEEEEQLTPEELQSLETMMKEFPRLSTFDKREDGRTSNWGSSSHNEIIPVHKNLDKQKLKWQEETQKALNFPTFGRSSFIDELENSNSVVDYTGRPEQDATEEPQPDDEESKEEIDEEVLSPEEEEARAKAEQDEMRRQAAEAQRAKMEEEQLADIASDMLLRYMGKESHRKYSRPVSDTAEDKRSDEQQLKDEDDLDPQTIDKLIEISSKLHLPADDVVDIISDVEKKKRKDVAPDVSRWKPLSTSANNLAAPETKQTSSSHLKTWFHHKIPASQDLWSKPKKLQPSLWSKPQNAPGRWPKPLVYWSGRPVYPLPHPAYYRRRPYPAYYPLHPPPRPQSWSYTPKLYAFNNLMSHPSSSSYTFPQKPKYSPSWLLLRKPVSYYTNKPLSLNPWKFQLKAPPHRWPPLQKQYLSALTPAAGKEAYQGSEKKTEFTNRQDNLEKYIQQMVLKRAHLLD